MLPGDQPRPKHIILTEVARLADRVISLTKSWLTRDPRIAPIVVIGGRDDPQDSKLRREDEERRDRARLELLEAGKAAAAAIVDHVGDLAPLLKLIDCAERDDQVGGASARFSAKLLLQQVIYRCSLTSATSRTVGSDAVRVRCLRLIDQLIASIEEGKPGSELSSVRPLVWSLEEALRELDYERIPIQFELEERNGWCEEGFNLRYPWGGLQAVFLRKFRLHGKQGDQVRENDQSTENPISPDLKAEILRVLRAWRREIAGEIDAGAAPSGAQPTDRPARNKSPWTQATVDQAIRKYARSIDRRLRELARAAQKGDSGSVKAARAAFGRNAVMRQIGCSAGLVSKSRAWKAVAARLGLLGNTPGIGRSDRVGLEKATDALSHTEWKKLAAEQRIDEQSDQPRKRGRQRG